MGESADTIHQSHSFKRLMHSVLDDYQIDLQTKKNKNTPSAKLPKKNETNYFKKCETKKM